MIEVHNVTKRYGGVTAVDALLYAAKATGRDRVFSSADELPPAPAPA